jgi:hypothetical protein
MREDTWNALETMFARFPIMRTESVDVWEVDAASHKLGIPFASDYRDFVQRYGGAIVGPYPIFGVRRAEPMGRNEGSAVVVTRRFRQKRWPGTEAWVVFSIDHAGNPIGLDRGGRVWISDHDAGVLEVIANTFEEYLRKRCLKLE